MDKNQVMANLNLKFKVIQGSMLKINDKVKDYTKTVRQPLKELLKIISRMVIILKLKNTTICTRAHVRMG